VSLDDMDQGSISKRGREVTASAGFRLKDLIPHLATLGLGLRNMGSVTEQSIAGAISTGTHGTGLTLGCMSTQVTAVKMVTGTGDVVQYTAGDAEM
jgi:FAD/FMN-containing dehydrogenase